jgi:hypothetical protein
VHERVSVGAHTRFESNASVPPPSEKPREPGDGQVSIDVVVVVDREERAQRRSAIERLTKVVGQVE